MSQASVLAAARSEKRTLLTEVESKALLKEAGVPVVDTRLARTREEAAAIAKEIGYPVALKVVSPDIAHKSDIGGVKLGLRTEKQTAKAFDDIMKAVQARQPNARVHGVAVQKMARPGVEVIVGLSKDAQFGPVVMFGLGGIFVEVLKDVSFRIVPLLRRDAREMIREIKGFPVLQGIRGQEAVDIAALEDILLKVSELAERHPEIKELDLNPILAYKDGAVAVDARVVLEGETPS
ncbi:MAG: acetate--CoA ligase family protein [Dehalococcoidia bacterium]|nr:acetate--CoA ligase family protein [Dehalococcoidia bacterium]